MLEAYQDRLLRELKEQGTVTALAVNDPEQLQALDAQRDAAKEETAEQWWQPVD